MRRFSVPLISMLLLLASAACGGGESPTAGAGSTTTAQAASAEGGTPSATGKVSANNASEDELKAALTNAGVTNVDKWAHEIVEYRPYDTGDPSLGKLRESLQKYKPGTDTLNKIISALEP